MRGVQNREDLVACTETRGAEERVAHELRRTVHRKTLFQNRRAGEIERQTEVGREGQGT